MTDIFNLDDLFTYADAAPLEASEEARLIRIAQSPTVGDFQLEAIVEEAQLALLQAYGPVLRSTVGRFITTNFSETSRGALDVEDLRSIALAAFLEVIRDHDPEKGGRLAGIVSQRITRGLTDEFSEVSAVEVPGRTVRRFYGILREADGDVQEARDLAPSREMTHATFDAVLAAVGVASIDHIRELHLHGSEGGSSDGGDWVVMAPVFAPSPVVDVEDRILCDAALRACDDDEHRVVSLQYGFQAVVEVVDGQRVQVDRLPSDREIGDILGMTRPTVQRRGKSALTKMRKSLGVTVR